MNYQDHRNVQTLASRRMALAMSVPSTLTLKGRIEVKPHRSKVAAQNEMDRIMGRKPSK